MPVVALREMMVAVASLRTEPHSPGESFEQGRLPRAILAHEQRHRRRELKVEALLKQWNIERVHRWLDAILAEHDPRKKRAAVDGGGCYMRSIHGARHSGAGNGLDQYAISLAICPSRI